jgi:hypothetical protein
MAPHVTNLSNKNLSLAASASGLPPNCGTTSVFGYNVPLAPGETTCWQTAYQSGGNPGQALTASYSGQTLDFGSITPPNGTLLDTLAIITQPIAGNQNNSTIGTATDSAPAGQGLAGYPSVDGTRGDGTLLWGELTVPGAPPSQYTGAPAGISGSLSSSSGSISTSEYSNTSIQYSTIIPYCDGSASYFVVSPTNWNSPVTANDTNVNFPADGSGIWSPLFPPSSSTIYGNYDDNLPQTWCIDAGRPVSQGAKFIVNASLNANLSPSHIFAAGIFGAEQAGGTVYGGSVLTDGWWMGDGDFLNGGVNSSDYPASLTISASASYQYTWVTSSYPSGINTFVQGAGDYGCGGGNSSSCSSQIQLPFINSAAPTATVTYSGLGSVTAYLLSAYSTPPAQLDNYGSSTTTSSSYSFNANTPAGYSLDSVIADNGMNMSANSVANNQINIPSLLPNLHTYYVTFSPAGAPGDTITNSISINYEPQLSLPSLPSSISSPASYVIGSNPASIAATSTRVDTGDTIYILSGQNNPMTTPTSGVLCSYNSTTGLQGGSSCTFTQNSLNSDSQSVTISYTPTSPTSLSSAQTDYYSTWVFDHATSSILSEKSNNLTSVTWYPISVTITSTANSVYVNQPVTLTASISAQGASQSSWSNWQGGSLSFYQVGVNGNPDTVASCQPTSSSPANLSSGSDPSSTYTCIVTSSSPQALSFYAQLQPLSSTNRYVPVSSADVSINWAEPIMANPT